MLASSKRILGAALFGLVAVSAGDARADLPPPPGQTRVGYSFRVTGTVKDAVLVAYPLYNSGGGTVVDIVFDKDLVPIQGWTPGIYSLSSADATALRAIQEPKDAADFLEKKAHVCVKSVPRLFNVPSATHVSSAVDVFQIDATATSCKASFAKSIYTGEKGEKGEGTVDAAGHRIVPAPFGKGLPDVGDLGFALDGKAPPTPSTPPTSSPSAAPSGVPSSTPSSFPTAAPQPTDDNAPKRGGCAGCIVSGSDDAPLFGGLLALGIVAGLVSRRRNR